MISLPLISIYSRLYDLALGLKKFLLEPKPEIAALVVSKSFGQSSAAFSVKRRFLTVKFLYFIFVLDVQGWKVDYRFLY